MVYAQRYNNESWSISKSLIYVSERDKTQGRNGTMN